ncbi:intermembrane phospholipid transport protein YdbH family protein [Allosphingosinicella indica]|uniref:Dicarboxylate transport n=1 Tax=Allosphingosinicella indica TaxID=941907 RepID=A0A1X7H0Y1_9SPHN|nr:YdbH domain-containing protein [Allosphingosinicella indica]SMF77015.1 Dicarboxylate transport [Allosphingosinicella indica]
MEPEDIAPRRRWRPTWRFVLLGILLVGLLALAILWAQRKPLAQGLINDELQKRGVNARYQIADLGLRRQRLVDVVIGDPADPDLVAKAIDVDLSLGFDGSTKVEFLRIRGARLKGRVVGGELRLGEIDKLLPPPSGKPFTLPDIDVDIDDSSLRLETPAGRVGLAIRGRGNLADGFDGRVVAKAPRMALGDCRLERGVARVALSVRERRPGIEGPVGAGGLQCAGRGVALEAPEAIVDARLSEALDRWRGNARLALPSGRIGDRAFARLTGTVGFDGSANAMRGTMDLAAEQARMPKLQSGALRLAGGYRWTERGGVAASGDAAADGLRFAPSLLAPATAPLESLDGSPVGPIGAALADAVRRAGRSANVRGRFQLVSDAGGGALRIRRMTADTASGARLALSGGTGATYYFGLGRARLDGTVTLAGGDFPDTRIALSQPVAGAPIRGTATVAPMAAGATRLALAPVRFGPGAGGATRIETAARISGPLADGRVENLQFPISGRIGPRGRYAFGETCIAARFDSLRISGLVLGRSTLPVCPSGPAIAYADARGRLAGGARIPGARIAGRLGGSPLNVTTREVRVALAKPGFAADQVAIRLGPEGAVHRLDLARIAGDFTSAGIAGTFAGADGKLANVPLLVSGGEGRWTLRGGRLALEGGLTVSDDYADPRFRPLNSKDFKLTLADNRIDATASLNHPASGTFVTRATIRHDLGSGRGDAVLDVPGIRFTPNGFQPDALTRLTTGVVALVDGEARGQGRIAWSPEGVTSTGSFTTDNTNLAAAFGPVEGLATTVNFTDLLALESAPGQEARVKLIRSGIDVYDGVIRYQLLRDLKVRVEGGRWPFAGGELLLDETLLDFAQPTDKNLVFRVAGMDAAALIENFEFENISATGTFDGVIPMVFGERGGRIVGGHLVARPAGGTLSYIGELTDKDLGAYGKLAFDALKSLSYDKLIIDLDGSLDGEFLTRIELDGIARDSALAPINAGGIQGIIARRALGQLAKIPFEFNITVRGPFRTLMATARSLEDPSLLIQSALPPELREPSAFESPVQPEESEPMP